MNVKNVVALIRGAVSVTNEKLLDQDQTKISLYLAFFYEFAKSHSAFTGSTICTYKGFKTKQSLEISKMSKKSRSDTKVRQYT